MRIFKSKTDSKRQVPLWFGIAVIWWLFITMGILLPIYVEGTRAVLLMITRSRLTPSNHAAFSLAAFCTYFPIAYAWRRSPRFGVSVQIVIFFSLLLWLHRYDVLVLTTWYSYIGRLTLVCTLSASLFSVLFWLTSRAGTRSGP